MALVKKSISRKIHELVSITYQQSLCSQFSTLAVELPCTVVNAAHCTTIFGSLMHQVHLWNLKNTHPQDSFLETLVQQVWAGISWVIPKPSEIQIHWKYIFSTYLGESPEFSGHPAPLPVATRPQNKGECSGGGCICTLPWPLSLDTWWAEHWTGLSSLKKKHPRGLCANNGTSFFLAHVISLQFLFHFLKRASDS